MILEIDGEHSGIRFSASHFIPRHEKCSRLHGHTYILRLRLDGDIGKEGSGDAFELKTGFIELPVGFQWGPDLVAFRPYLFAEPFIGYAITDADKYDGTVKEAAQTWADNARNKLEYGFGLGAGIEIAKHVQISGQYFSNLGKVFKGENADASVKSLEDVKFQGIKVSLAILF